jgi:excisionase family DNA binding protein
MSRSKTEPVTLEEARKRDLLLTRAQVAEWLQVPVATLDGWAYRREGPAYLRVGRHARYKASDVQAWIDKNVDAKRKGW